MSHLEGSLPSTRTGGRRVGLTGLICGAIIGVVVAPNPLLARPILAGIELKTHPTGSALALRTSLRVPGAPNVTFPADKPGSPPPACPGIYNQPHSCYPSDPTHWGTLVASAQAVAEGQAVTFTYTPPQSGIQWNWGAAVDGGAVSNLANPQYWEPTLVGSVVSGCKSGSGSSASTCTVSFPFSDGNIWNVVTGPSLYDASSGKVGAVGTYLRVLPAEHKLSGTVQFPDGQAAQDTPVTLQNCYYKLIHTTYGVPDGVHACQRERSKTDSKGRFAFKRLQDGWVGDPSDNLYRGSSCDANCYSVWAEDLQSNAQYPDLSQHDATANLVVPQAEPAVTGLRPASGPLTGGNVVTVKGTGLGAVDRVCFKSAHSGECVKPEAGGTETSLKVKAPPEPDKGKNPDVVNVRALVIAANGSSQVSPVTPADRYSYELALTGVRPASGPLAGGNMVTVKGKGLGAVERMCFKSAHNVECVKPEAGGTETSLKVKAPPEPDKGKNPDVVDVRAVVFFGHSGTSATSPVTAADRYSYELAVTGVRPASGPLAGGNMVTVKGKGLGAVERMCFKSAHNVECVKPEAGGTETSLKVKAPREPDKGKNPDVVDVRAVVFFGHSGTSATSPVTAADRYTYKSKAGSGSGETAERSPVGAISLRRAWFGVGVPSRPTSDSKDPSASD